MADPAQHDGGASEKPAPTLPAQNSTTWAPPTPSPAPIGVAAPPRATATPEMSRRGYTPASQSPSAVRSGPYVPQFSAATQLILNRMKTEASFGQGRSGARSSTPEVKVEFEPTTYEDAKRRVIMGMNTTPTLQMPAAPRQAPQPTLPAPPPPPTSIPHLQAGYPISTVVPRAKMVNGAAGMSAIRRVTLGLTASGRPIQPKPERQPNPSTTAQPKEKKARAPYGSKTGTKRKRAAAKGQDDETSSLSSLSDASDDENNSTSDKPATPSAPPILTKSGRHVQKPTTYNPAEMESSSAKKRTHYSKVRTAEQALCKKCSRMHSPASNQIVFCDGCNEGWHQKCHDPWIDDSIVRDTKAAWFCAACQAKRATNNNTPVNAPNPPKRQKVAPLKESWADRTPQQKRAFLSTLPQQELVGLLMYSLELHPDLPIFPGTPDTPSTPGTPQTPSDVPINGRKGGRAQKGAKGVAASQQPQSQQDNDEEVDPLEPPWPKPGNGLYNLLPPEDEDDLLVDANDYESFSVILYDERGRKLEENGIPVRPV